MEECKFCVINDKGINLIVDLFKKNQVRGSNIESITMDDAKSIGGDTGVCLITFKVNLPADCYDTYQLAVPPAMD